MRFELPKKNRMGRWQHRPNVEISIERILRYRRKNIRYEWIYQKITMPKCLLCIEPYEISRCSWKPLRLIYMFIDIGINASRICMPSIRFIYDKTHYIIIFHRLPQHHPSFPPNTTGDPASQKKKQQQKPKKMRVINLNKQRLYRYNFVIVYMCSTKWVSCTFYRE